MFDKCIYLPFLMQKLTVDISNVFFGLKSFGWSLFYTFPIIFSLRSFRQDLERYDIENALFCPHQMYH